MDIENFTFFLEQWWRQDGVSWSLKSFQIFLKFMKRFFFFLTFLQVKTLNSQKPSNMLSIKTSVNVLLQKSRLFSIHMENWFSKPLFITRWTFKSFSQLQISTSLMWFLPHTSYFVCFVQNGLIFIENLRILSIILFTKNSSEL